MDISDDVNNLFLNLVVVNNSILMRLREICDKLNKRPIPIFIYTYAYFNDITC